ncbi:DNA polymerase IV [Kineosporia rhizophila]|uniref:DNA polymerase IV n=1 Tax=Kineosporia rhizophila TaxID=84633 RepID=UPI001E4D6BDF|nr:DNA polymerase IV [Kineosporia rhizophila]MCE0539296.1 DNA polymerase IV [Kineosporia rhizophila]
MRTRPVILHLDLDAFFSAVEQLHKPSLRGKPVVVGGTGRRGVVATASYEARRFGVGSAMSIIEARRRCPNAAYLTPRFHAYRAASRVVMGLLAEVSPLIEQMSVDEAYVDLTPTHPGIDVPGVTELAEEVRRRIREATGLTASVGVGTSKLVAKIGSDLNKPDGLTVVAPGTERQTLAALPVRRLPGIGPATQERLHKFGMHTVGEVAEATEKEIVGILGQAHGTAVHQHARGIDNRELEPERDAKSVSAEETFSRDLTDRRELNEHARRMAERVVGRITKDGLCARTITIKVRSYDFSTITRSFTLDQPTDSLNKIMSSIRHLLDAVDVSDGIRLLGVGVAGLTDFAQTDLLSDLLAEVGDEPDERLPVSPPVLATVMGGTPEKLPLESEKQPSAKGFGWTAELEETTTSEPDASGVPEWRPGQDVVHTERGPGWVQGAGLGRVTVRFEGPHTGPGPIKTFRADDPDLSLGEPPVW